VWIIFGCFAIWPFLLAFVTPWFALAIVPLLLIALRMVRVGFAITEKDVRIIGYVKNRRVARGRIKSFTTLQGRESKRLAIELWDGERPVLLPLGEDLLIPAKELARDLNALYGLSATSD
jgi:hypothetical protein